MQDLTHLAVDSIWATSQHAGNRPSDPSTAMTAPGSPSPSVDESATSPAGGGGDIASQPTVVMDAYDTPVVIDADGSKQNPDNADRSNPFTRDDGAGWRTGTDSATPLPPVGPRNLLRRGGGWDNRNEF